MTANIFAQNTLGLFALGLGSVGTRTTYALDTAFTLGIAGKCLGIRFTPPINDTIDDILFFVSAAPAGAHNLSVNVCTQTNNSRAGALLTNGNILVSGGTANNKWIKASYSSKPSVSVGTSFWIVIGDPSGAAANYSILSRGVGPVISTLSGSPFAGYTSSDGFATNGSAVTGPAAIIHFTSGLVIGAPYTLVTTAGSSAAVERGWKITPETDLTIAYHFFTAAPAAGSTLKIYADGQNPGGTILPDFNGGAAFTLTASALNNLYTAFPPCILKGGLTYRVVVHPSGVTTSPGFLSIEDDTVPNNTLLEACGFPGSLGMQYTEESGGTWADSPDKIPRHALGIYQIPIVGGPLLGGRLIS